jgi:predicted transcriptional regulator
MKTIIDLKTNNASVVEFTAEEIVKNEQDKQKFLAEEQAKAEAEAEAQAQKEAEETAKATAQATGNQKLLDLGLTQAEATALTGYTPPSEV